MQDNSKWQSRYAGLMALGSIAEGPSHEKYRSIIYQAMPSLVNMFTDSAPKVREMVAWLFQRLAESHNEIFDD